MFDHNVTPFVRPHRLALCALLALAGPATADVLTVPGDHPTLGAALQAAAAGDTILLQTTDEQEFVTIDKPVSIVGDPVGYIGNSDFCTVGTYPPAVSLAGPGSGTVSFTNVALQALYDCPFTQPLIVGQGFSELQFFDCLVAVPSTGLNGYGTSAPAISVQVPDLLIVGSIVVGGRDYNGLCANFDLTNPAALIGYNAIDTPGSNVSVLDSYVEGGGWLQICCQFCECPKTLDGAGGVGVPAIRAASLYRANSEIVGGEGAEVVAWSGAPFYSEGENCGLQPNGDDVEVSSDVSLPGELFGNPTLQIGKRWDLEFDVPGPTAYLFASLGVDPPYETSLGWIYLGIDSIFRMEAVATGGPEKITFTVPDEPSLLGLVVGFQIVDETLGITRPVAGVMVPAVD